MPQESARYRLLVDTYETERLKVLSTWSMFRDDDLQVRPHLALIDGSIALEITRRVQGGAKVDFFLPSRAHSPQILQIKRLCEDIAAKGPCLFGFRA